MAPVVPCSAGVAMAAVASGSGNLHRQQLAESYACLHAPLCAFLASHTHSIHDAEDLAQEVFLRLWRMEDESQIRSLKAFAFKIASNLLKDRGRRTYTRMMRNSVPAGALELADSAGEPCGVVEGQQTLAAFEAAVDGMRPSSRQAFLLYRLEARSHGEIAQQMGISVSMVEKHVSTAMTALRTAGIECRDR